MNNRVINFTSYLLCLLPLALLTGPFLPDLIISIIAVIFILNSLISREWFYYKNKFFVIFIIFCFYLIIRSLLTPHPMMSLESSLFYFRFGFFSLGVWYLLNHDKKLINKFYYFLLLTFCLALIEGYFQVINYEFYKSDTNFIGIHCNEVRLCLTFNDKLFLGGYLSRLLPLVFAFMLYRNTSNMGYIYFAAFILIAVDVLVYVSGERTALGLTFISTLLIILLIKRFKYIRILTLIVSIIIISFITLFSETIKERNIDHTYEQVFNDDNDTDSKITFSKQHDPIYFTAFAMFLDSPIVGKGPKLFREYCSHDRFNEYSNEYSNGCSTHPHNIYIQLLAETGIIGFAFILIAAFYVAKQLLTHMYRVIFNKKILLSNYQACLLVCFALTLFPFLPTQNLFNGWISIIYFLPVGFYLHSIHKDKLSEVQET